MKHLLFIAIVLLSAGNSLFSQVTLSINSANPKMGDTFDIDVTVSGFDSLSSGQFRLKWDPSIIRLDGVEMPVDTISNESPFRNNSDPNRITFLYLNDNGIGADGSLSDGSTLLRLSFTAIGNSGDSTCFMIDPSGALEFIKLASEELPVTVITGCVHLQGVNALQPQEQRNLNCYWQRDGSLLVDYLPSANPAIIQVFSLDGRLLTDLSVKPHSTSTPIHVSQQWHHSLLVVRYSQQGFSHTRLIAGPR